MSPQVYDDPESWIPSLSLCRLCVTYGHFKVLLPLHNWQLHQSISPKADQLPVLLSSCAPLTCGFPQRLHFGSSPFFVILYMPPLRLILKEYSLSFHRIQHWANTVEQPTFEHGVNLALIKSLLKTSLTDWLESDVKGSLLFHSALWCTCLVFSKNAT